VHSDPLNATRDMYACSAHALAQRCHVLATPLTSRRLVAELRAPRARFTDVPRHWRSGMNERSGTPRAILPGATLLAIIASIGLGACEKQGPLERAGEEVDEAVNTLKNDGDETTADQVDDAIDEAREGVSDAADELKKD
jgi:hypothetical protein